MIPATSPKFGMIIASNKQGQIPDAMKMTAAAPVSLAGLVVSGMKVNPVVKRIALSTAIIAGLYEVAAIFSPKLRELGGTEAINSAIDSAVSQVFGKK